MESLIANYMNLPPDDVIDDYNKRSRTEQSLILEALITYSQYTIFNLLT